MVFRTADMPPNRLWASVFKGSAAFAVLLAARPEPAAAVMTVTVDPLTRCIHLTYPVPSEAGPEVHILCSWSPMGKNEWRPARVAPLLSETAVGLLQPDDWKPWVQEGRIAERRAAGLARTVVFNPYPEAQVEGRVDVDFRVQIRTPDGTPLASHQTRVQADNSDVVYIEDWSRVLQRDRVVPEAQANRRTWIWRTGLDAKAGVTLGNGLYGQSEPDIPLPQLTYPLNLRGEYAVFACTNPSWGGIRMRLSGDERTDSLGSRRPGEEVFWQWRRMDRQHLVLKQGHTYTGYANAHIDYVKLVPLSKDVYGRLESQFGGTPDKLIIGYWEPYSWAFCENVQETLQHREPLVAFAEARIGIVDTQIGRFGCKAVYETRLTDPLLHGTIGDPIGNVTQPKTDNVGRMQQYTNTLDATLRYCRDLGMVTHANFGAGNCYIGTPLQGDISKKHPDWVRGHALRFEVPQVRQYALSLYREALEIGVSGVSIDFCRYPETIDKAETCTTFLRELRQLTGEFKKMRGKDVPILIRFPGRGVRRWQMFDYTTWVREKLVDYLCPSNLQGRHMHIDMAPYWTAVQGTDCKLLPCVDALSWGLPMPGPFLWRVARLYEMGVPGLYVYQADGRILSTTAERRCIRMLASSQAIRQFWQNEDRDRPLRSKGIYITAPHEFGVYHGWERLRIWTEGIPMGPCEIYLDGKLITTTDGPPYLVGTEENESDNVISRGEHQLRIRAKDGDGWLERTFAITGG